MTKYWMGGLLVATLSYGCTEGRPVKPPVAPMQQTSVSEPQLHSHSSGAVGEVIYQEYVLMQGTGASLATGKNFTTNVLFGEVRLLPGSLLHAKAGADYPTYCTAAKVYTRFVDDSPSDIACFADDDGDGWFDRVQVPSVKFGSWTDSEGPHYQLGAVDRHSQARQQLVYLGRTENSVKIGYRRIDENGDETASQTVEYALAAAGATEVGYRKLRMRIDAATNSEIRYEIVRGF
ncbi:MAG: hypothetical protein KDH88_06305 [Chromatiales bacterium]|nr:hypothetical protein [Chromatiales bacterium]